VSPSKELEALKRIDEASKVYKSENEVKMLKEEDKTSVVNQSATPIRDDVSVTSVTGATGEI